MNASVQYGLKVVVSAIVLVVASELGKRNPFWGSVLISLPLTSILALIWLYQDTKDIQLISEMSWSILWLVIASLVFFILLPFLLKKQMPFYGAMTLSIALTAMTYWLTASVARLIK